MITISELIEIDEAVVAAFEHLVPQLSSSSPPPTIDALRDIAANPHTHLLIARDTDTGTIVGTLALAFYRIPTGLQARIEDVVVDVSVRGEGVGVLLTNEAVARATKAGAKSVGLTSRPAREAANKLYQSLGFSQRETNVYSLKLT